MLEIAVISLNVQQCFLCYVHKRIDFNELDQNLLNKAFFNSEFPV